MIGSEKTNKKTRQGNLLLVLIFGDCCAQVPEAAGPAINLRRSTSATIGQLQLLKSGHAQLGVHRDFLCVLD
jgi:hypothetical protein